MAQKWEQPVGIGWSLDKLEAMRLILASQQAVRW